MSDGEEDHLGWQAAEIIGVSARTMRRWRERLEQDGYDGLVASAERIAEDGRSD